MSKRYARMKRVDIKVGFTCNNNCMYCVVGDERGKTPDLSTDEVYVLLDNFAGKADEVILTGGEISIRDDMCEIVNKAKSLGFKYVTIQTNGRMFSRKEVAENVKKAGVDWVVVALQAPVAEIHNRLTRTMSFHQTVAGIKNLLDLDLNVATNTLTMSMNMRHLASLTLFLCRLGVRLMHFSFPHIMGTAALNAQEIVPRKTELMPYLIDAMDKCRKRGMDFLVEAIPFCLMKGYEQYIAEVHTPDTTMWRRNNIIEDYSAYRLNQGKSKGEQCGLCGYHDVCEGPWKEYPELYGWSEFQPVPRDQTNLISLGITGFNPAGFMPHE